MVYYFYILYSLRDRRLYKGVTSDVGQRLIKHNSGSNHSTKHRRPFVLIYTERFDTKSEALKAERYYKSTEGGIAIKAKMVEWNILDQNGLLK